jgi:hypothetical protein
VQVGREAVEPIPAPGLARPAVAAMVDGEHAMVTGQPLHDGDELLGRLRPSRQAHHWARARTRVQIRQRHVVVDGEGSLAHAGIVEPRQSTCAPGP